jgi:hypothetical protein
MLEDKMKSGILIIAAFLFVLPISAFAQAPDTLWTRTYGNPTPGYVEDCWEAVITPDGGLALVGTYVIQGYSTNLYILRIDSSGDTLWSRTYDDLSYGRAISATPDNGFIISGYIVENTNIPYILKIDSSPGVIRIGAREC